MVSVLWSVLYKWSTRHRYLAIYTGATQLHRGIMCSKQVSHISHRGLCFMITLSYGLIVTIIERWSLESRLHLLYLSDDSRKQIFELWREGFIKYI